MRRTHGLSKQKTRRLAPLALLLQGTLKRGKALLLCLTIILLAIALGSNATPPLPEFPFETSLQSEQPITGPGEYLLRFTYTPRLDEWRKVQLSVTTEGQLELLSPSTWDVSIDSGTTAVQTLRIVVQPSDTAALRIVVHQGDDKITCLQMFFTSTETAATMSETRSHFGRSHIQHHTTQDFQTDTLSKEQLQQVYRWEFTLESNDDREFVQKMLGALHDSALLAGASNTYIRHMSLEKALEIHRRGIRIDLAPDIPAKSDQQGKEALDPPLPR